MVGSRSRSVRVPGHGLISHHASPWPPWTTAPSPRSTARCGPSPFPRAAVGGSPYTATPSTAPPGPAACARRDPAHSGLRRSVQRERLRRRQPRLAHPRPHAGPPRTGTGPARPLQLLGGHRLRCRPGHRPPRPRPASDQSRSAVHRTSDRLRADHPGPGRRVRPRRLRWWRRACGSEFLHPSGGAPCTGGAAPRVCTDGGRARRRLPGEGRGGELRMTNPIVKALEHGAAKLGQTLGKDAGKAVEDLYHGTGKRLKKAATHHAENDAKHAKELDKILKGDKEDIPHAPHGTSGGGRPSDGGRPGVAPSRPEQATPMTAPARRRGGAPMARTRSISPRAGRSCPTPTSPCLVPCRLSSPAHTSHRPASGATSGRRGPPPSTSARKSAPPR